jgi:UDP-N-acetylmuramyl tripeptide synthase
VERLPAIPGGWRDPQPAKLHLFVDYAHTPEGLDVVLSTLEGWEAVA